MYPIVLVRTDDISRLVLPSCNSVCACVSVCDSLVHISHRAEYHVQSWHFSPNLQRGGLEVSPALRQCDSDGLYNVLARCHTSARSSLKVRRPWE